MLDFHSPQVQARLQASVLCWLATHGRDGYPSVSPKEIFVVRDAAHLLIADIASPNSVGNIQANARVCVSFIDLFVQKGFKVYGEARLLWPQDADFAAALAPLEALTQGKLAIRHVIEVKAHAFVPVLAPSYRFFAEASEEQSRLTTWARYQEALAASQAAPSSFSR